MKRFRLFVMSFTVILTFSLILSACGTSSSSTSNNKTTQKVNIVFGWWGEKARHDATMAAIKIWNSKHPEIQVEGAFQGWDGYHAKLQTQIAGKAAPDVFQLSQSIVEELSDNNVLLDLTPYINTDLVGIDKNLWSGLTFNGKIYAVPGGINADTLAYNKTKLDKMGIAYPNNDESWDTLFERCKAAVQDLNGDGKTDIWGIFDPMDVNPDYIDKYIQPFGVSVWTPDLKGCDFTNPKVIEAVKKYSRFREAKVIVPPDVSLIEGQSYLGQGYVAYSLSFLSAFTGALNTATDEVGIVMPPKPPAGGKDLRAAYTSLDIGINANSKNVDASMKFLSWFLTDPEAAKATGMVRGVFPSKAQRDALGDKVSVNDKALLDIASRIQALGNPINSRTPKNITQFTDVYTQEKDRYLLDMCTLEQFFAKVQEAGTPILAQE